MLIRLRLNGATTELDVAPMRRLLDVLREELGLRGAQAGCADGSCGACSVLLDQEAVPACLVVIGQCDGRELVTVEGLSRREYLGALRRALSEDAGGSCGLCEAGMLIASEALLRKHAAPSDEQIGEALAGNLCRCTGYERIAGGVRAAAAQLAQGAPNGRAP